MRKVVCLLAWCGSGQLEWARTRFDHRSVRRIFLPPHQPRHQGIVIQSQRRRCFHCVQPKPLGEFRCGSRRCPCEQNQWDRCQCECRNIPVRTEIFIFRRSTLSPFAQALFGFAHSNAAFNGTATSANGFAMSPGVGLDWNFTHHLGLRLGQVDYLFQRVPTSTNQVNWNNFRYSAGGLFFGSRIPSMHGIFIYGAAWRRSHARSRKGRSTEFLRPSSLSGIAILLAQSKN